MIGNAFDENDESLASAILADLDGILMNQVPDILGADSPADGSMLARLMREAVAQALSAPRPQSAHYLPTVTDNSAELP